MHGPLVVLKAAAKCYVASLKVAEHFRDFDAPFAM